MQHSTFCRSGKNELDINIYHEQKNYTLAVIRWLDNKELSPHWDKFQIYRICVEKRGQGMLWVWSVSVGLLHLNLKTGHRDGDETLSQTLFN